MKVVYVPFPDRRSADRAIGGALDRRLAACANAFPIRSEFWWKGRREKAREVAVLFKTTPENARALFEFLTERHPYEVPDIAELRVGAAHPPFVAYLRKALEDPRPGRERGRRRRGSGPTARRPG